MCHYVEDKSITCYPFKLVAELTYRCNLKCIYCHNPVNKELFRDELTTRQWMDIIRDAKELDVVEINFTGGEPTLRNDLCKLVSYAKKLDFRVGIDTNATLMNDDLCKRLIRAGIDHVQIGFPSISANIEKKVTGSAMLKNKIKTIRTFVRHAVPVFLNVVLTRKNITEVKKIIRLSEDLGVSMLIFQPAYLYGRAAKYACSNEKILPSRNQMKYVLEVLREAEKGSSIRIHKPSLFYYTGLPMPCSWQYEGVLVITPNGLITPCEPASNLYPLVRFDNIRTKKSLYSIWINSQALKMFNDLRWLPEVCRRCEYKNKCRGGCRVKALLITGNLYAEDPTCFASKYRQVIETFLS